MEGWVHRISSDTPLHWTAIQSMPFRIRTTNDNFSLYWIKVERILATARGHKQRSASNGFPNISLFVCALPLDSMSQDWGKIAGLHVSLKLSTNLVRRQRESFGSKLQMNSINLSVSVLSLFVGCPLILIRSHHPPPPLVSANHGNLEHTVKLLLTTTSFIL